MRSVSALIVTLAVLLAAGSAHAAGDFCFNTATSPYYVVVAQRFKVPRPGKCAAIVGFEYGSTGFTFPRPVSGTACTDSAGTLLHVGIMIHAASGPSPVNTDSEIHVHMKLAYPGLATGDVYVRRDLPLLSLTGTAGFAGPCGIPITIP
jgi:hypothetical protein